jgi:hypothetical protein
VVQKGKHSTTPQQFEEDHIQLITMRNVKVVQTNSNERLLFIQCETDQYKESNATIQARHPKLFKMILTYLVQVRNW